MLTGHKVNRIGEGGTMLVGPIARLIYLGLAVATAVAWCTEVGAQEDSGSLRAPGLYMKLDLEKHEYLVAEPIFLVTWLENMGGKTEDYRTRDLMDITVQDGQGRSLKMKGMLPPEEMSSAAISTRGSDPGRARSRGTLPPGEVTQKGGMNILYFFGEGQRGCVRFYLRPGVYSVTATKVCSDTARFVVKEPTEADDISAKELLIITSDSCLTPRFATYEKEYEFYENFVKRYPRCVYTPVALVSLLGLAETPPFVDQPERKQHFAEYLIANFPESGFAYRGLLALNASSVKSDDKAAVAAGIKSLKSRLLGADLRKRADELIGQLEK
jgi:hypothetical protein